jgi:hypothetical protein
MVNTKNGEGLGKITKVDAVGRALAKLGTQASRPEIQSWVKDHFGYEMSLDHISDCKKNLAKRSGATTLNGRRKPGPKPGAKRRTTAALPPQEPTPVAVFEKITKKEAVRRSLAKLGKDAMPVDIQKDIKERFSIEMNTGHISTTKGELLRKGRKAKKPGAKEPEAAPVQAQPAPAPEAGDRAKGTVGIGDILTVRALLDRLGAEHLQTLIEVMTRR